MYTHIDHVYIYIYKEREREREFYRGEDDRSAVLGRWNARDAGELAAPSISRSAASVWAGRGGVVSWRRRRRWSFSSHWPFTGGSLATYRSGLSPSGPRWLPLFYFFFVSNFLLGPNPTGAKKKEQNKKQPSNSSHNFAKRNKVVWRSFESFSIVKPSKT